MLCRYFYNGIFVSICLLPLLCLQNAFAQNLDKFSLEKGLQVNGGLNLNLVGYNIEGLPNRRDPFNYFLTSNLNISMFGYSAPLSFSYSNAGGNFSQPFNQFRFAPSYKWAKVYVGYSALNFSNYTLAGHVFNGIGAELNPGKWRIAMMYGRLRKAVPFDLEDSLQQVNASFKRMGWGIKVGYENNGDVYSINFFSAKDELNSIPFVLPESQLTPQQNIALGFNIRKTIYKKIFIETEYAISTLNLDTRINSNKDSVAIKPTENFIRELLPENATNRYYDAFNVSIGYTGNYYAIRIRYEQVAPEYQTLGAYFFNNDLRNITIAPTFRLLKNKLNIATNIGYQENNLDKTRAATTKRLVASINNTLLLNDKLNLALSYSNFSTSTNIRPINDPFFQNSLDTLNFYQVSQTGSFMLNKIFGNEQSPKSILFSVNYQAANDNGAQTLDNSSKFLAFNAGYTTAFKPSNLMLSLAGNYYVTKAAGTDITYIGPSLTVSKSFLEKTLSLSLLNAYNTTNSTVKVSPVLNNRLTLNYNPKTDKENSRSGSHTISISASLVNRIKSYPEQPSFSEFTGILNYSYQFN